MWYDYYCSDISRRTCRNAVKVITLTATAEHCRTDYTCTGQVRCNENTVKWFVYNKSPVLYPTPGNDNNFLICNTTFHKRWFLVEKNYHHSRKMYYKKKKKTSCLSLSGLKWKPTFAWIAIYINTRTHLNYTTWIYYKVVVYVCITLF